MTRTSMSTNELAKQLNIPLASLRRYLKQHGHLLNLQKEHKNYLIGEDLIDTLTRIREAYAQGLSADEVENRVLSGAARFTTGEPVSVSLVEALSNLERVMYARFEHQEQLLASLLEVAATHHPVIERDSEFRVMERAERLNDRLTEWRIERRLQAEAEAKWSGLSKAHRMMRTGLFRYEESRDKRERFIRDYVDNRFETEMRRAYDLPLNH